MKLQSGKFSSYRIEETAEERKQAVRRLLEHAKKYRKTSGRLQVRSLWSQRTAISSSSIRMSCFTWRQITRASHVLRAASSKLVERSAFRSWNLAERYKVPIYDALIIASVIDAGCTLVMTEDFQHGRCL